MGNFDGQQDNAATDIKPRFLKRCDYIHTQALGGNRSVFHARGKSLAIRRPAGLKPATGHAQASSLESTTFSRPNRLPLSPDVHFSSAAPPLLSTRI